MASGKIYLLICHLKLYNRHSNFIVENTRKSKQILLSVSQRTSAVIEK